MDKTFDARVLGVVADADARRPERRAAMLVVACLGAVSLVACGGSSGLGADGGGTGGMTGGGGGGGSGATCAAVAACGGAIVGNWAITDTCVNSAMDLSSICSGISASIAFSFSGSSTYNADLTYTQSGTVGGIVHYQFPAACIGTQTCAQVQAALLSAGSTAGMGLTFQSGTCSAQAGGCTCDAVIANSSADETGTYVTTGGTVSTTHTGTTDQSLYCVNGSTMHQMPTPDQGLTGAIIFTKQ